MKKELITVFFLILLFSFLSGCFDATKKSSQKSTPSINVFIFGYVDNIEGENLEFINITVYNSKYNWQNHTITNETGYYRLGLFAGSFTITIDHIDYEEQFINYDFIENEKIWKNITVEDVNREEFYFTNLKGDIENLNDYRGKVVILDLWATWCNPCHAVMPELKKIYDHYGRNDLEIMSVNIDYRENVQYIQSFIDWFEEQYNIELNWIFGRDEDSILEKYMNEGAIPTLAVFDQKGRLYYRKAGVHAYKEIPAGFPESTPTLAPIIEELIS
ncbi:MAG: hypothetical protein AYK22_04025 [Thermoplasmatales archaeon SG8-52-3]|nr:MAG: hypothetical protein AYK22_04025 [Thermoplasmatales archaeon SG8-52-3]